MKTLFRVLVILVFASLIGGAMFAAVSAATNSSSQTLPGGDGRPAFDGDGDRPAPPEGAEFRPDHDRDFEGGFGLPGGVIKALVIISVVGVVYYLPSKFLGRKKPVAAVN